MKNIIDDLNLTNDHMAILIQHFNLAEQTNDLIALNDASSTITQIIACNMDLINLWKKQLKLIKSRIKASKVK